jgi:Protein of unknown function (DUF1552)
MITSKNRIHRRTVLRGAGGVAIGLPFLSAMLRPLRSHAQATTPTRFIVFYSPGGTLLDKWTPTGATDNFTLQSMMSPLTPFHDRLTIVDGLELSVTAISTGHPHSRGMGAVLTGMPLLAGNFNTNGGNAGFADGPSVDQVIAGSISTGLKFKSLEVSSGWSTGIAAGGMPHPANSITYAGSKTPIPPATDAPNTLSRVFTGTGGTGTTTQPTVNLDGSILTSVMDQYRYYMAKLGTEDRAKLDAHLQMISEAEKGIKAPVPTTTGTCPTPTASNTTAIPEKGKIMTDLLVAALACDLTRVGTMQWTDSEAKFPLSFLNGPDGKPLVDNHHAYQHDKGFQPGALEVIYNWYASNFVYLLQKMDAVKEGNGMSLLDNSVVVWISEIQKPDSHAQQNMPFVIAGKAAGKLKSNRWLKVSKQSHNNMWVSMLNLFGLPNTKFGHQNYCTGPLAGLL